MFEQVDSEKAGVPWGTIGALAAFGALLVAGYFMIS